MEPVETYKRRRDAENELSRVAVHATVVYTVPEYLKLRGIISFSSGLDFADFSSGPAARARAPGEIVGICRMKSRGTRS